MNSRPIAQVSAAAALIAAKAGMRIGQRRRHVVAFVGASLALLLAPVAPANASATSSKGLPVCRTIDATASNCTLPLGPSTVSGTLDAVAGTGSVTATIRNGVGSQAWRTVGSAVTHLHFKLPAGQTLTAASIDSATTTCTVVSAKRRAPGTTVAVSANGINVNNIICADGNVLVLNTTASGVTLEAGTVTGGVVLQYKTSDPRSTKTSLWRATGDYIVGGGGGCTTDVLATEGGYRYLIFSGPTAVLENEVMPGLPAGNIHTPVPATTNHSDLYAWTDFALLASAGCYTAEYSYRYVEAGCTSPISWTPWPPAGGGGETCGGNWAYLATSGPSLFVPTGGQVGNDSFHLDLTWTGTGGPTVYTFDCCD